MIRKLVERSIGSCDLCGATVSIHLLPSISVEAWGCHLPSTHKKMQGQGPGLTDLVSKIRWVTFRLREFIINVDSKRKNSQKHPLPCSHTPTRTTWNKRSPVNARQAMGCITAQEPIQTVAENSSLRDAGREPHPSPKVTRQWKTVSWLSQEDGEVTRWWRRADSFQAPIFSCSGRTARCSAKTPISCFSSFSLIFF